MFRLQILFALLSVFLLASCRENPAPTPAKNSASAAPLKLRHARNFSIDSLPGGSLGVSVKVFLGSGVSEARYLLVHEGDSPVEGWEGAVKIAVPVRRVIALSGGYYAFFKELGKGDLVIALGDKKNVADSALYERMVAGAVQEVGDGPQFSEEKAYALAPDLVIGFATGGAFDADFSKLREAGIPVLLASEWQETSALARAEWLLLFGALAGIDADGIFGVLEAEYLAFRDSVRQDSCVKVLAGTPAAGFWFAPGGESYTASLLKDAGACLVFAPDSTRERKFPVEEAFAAALSAKVWVNPGFSDPKALVASEPRVEKLPAFLEKQVYQFDKLKGPAGALDFYEGATLEPARLLRDLYRLVWSGHKADSSLTWYRNIFYN